MNISTVRALAAPRLVVLLGTASSAALSPAGALAATIRVPAAHPTIQQAVHAAGPGDVIRVAPGTYPEAIRIAGAKDGLVIEAENEQAPPVIRGTRNKSADGIRIDLVDHVGLRHLRIEGAYNGVRLNHVTGATLVGLVLVDNALAVRVNHGRDNIVLRCTIVGARVEQGIRVDDSPRVTLADNVVTRTDREGIRVLDSPDAIVDRNHATDSRGADGIKVEGSPRASVERCTTGGNYRNGIRVSGSPDLVLSGNTADRNRNAGFRIEHSAPFRSVSDVLAAGNRAAGNRAGDVVVEPPRCNVKGCVTTPPTSTPTTPSVTAPPTTSTTTPQPRAAAGWRFYVSIATVTGPALDVNVPFQALLPPVATAIRADHLPAFRVGDQVSGAEIAALGGDTHARLVTAAEAHIRAHPARYPGFAAIRTLQWAKRVAD